MSVPMISHPMGGRVQDRERLVTAEMIRALMTYDPTTGVFTRKVTVASNAKAGMTAGSLHSTGYVHIRINRVDFKAHRLAWLYVHGVWPEGPIDHANGVLDDNRIANLREASFQQNCANAKLRKDNSSGSKGVKRFKNRWQARIGENGKIHLGAYDTKAEAAAAYAGAAKVMYGKFARLG